MITTDSLPSVRWRSADDVTAVLTVPPPGC